MLARLKRLRGTPLDLFGYTAERRAERQLIADYEALIDELLRGLTPDNHATAVELASIPERIRGFGQVKERLLAPRQAARGRAAGGVPTAGRAADGEKDPAGRALR